ncbi:hypothetical protein BEL04_08450 [Mucilaginibacter sp. PPCGB 2223]|uniref:DUF6119 family protein n=1 Tax=Mucilaginibacter sp. PPCGB 2223 TaxID=1886027 RepID=UPI000825C213|nr:DUF6119 family protein [Mucilaginibacter sp. PPCGB 2223]OCX54278.1 hypothetical protein BEL04_08450 [Mucilaginibacter sp. PPCGB 2223]
MKLTVRLGKPGRTTTQLLKKNHGLTGPIENWNGINGSELYYGQSYDGEPAWKKFLEEGMDETLELNNQGAAAVLFVPTTKQRQLIYVFGYGFLSVQIGFTEWDFGLKVVLNSVYSDGLKSVDSHSLDYKAKNRRVQLGTQGSVGEFDIDIMQDLVSHISGLSSDKNFAKTLSGGESLHLTVDLEGSSLVKKGQEIMAQYEGQTYKTSFAWIDFISPIKDEQLINHLNLAMNQHIDDHIAGGQGNEIVLSFPTVIDMDNLDHFRFNGYGSITEYELIDFDSFVKDYRVYHQQLIHDTEDIRIQLYNGHEKIFQSFTLYKCITTEIEDNGHFYILSHGQWFQLAKTHYEKVNHFFDQLLRSAEYLQTGVTLEQNEPNYLATISGPNLQVLDRDLYYGSGGTSNAVEYGDIVNDAGEIVHVKDGASSSKLSHLFNQGLVSARLLSMEKDFRMSLDKKLTNKTIKSALHLKKIDVSEITVVFRILRKGPNFNLPFFSKIILFDTYQKIKSMGYRFRLEWVEKQ